MKDLFLLSFIVFSVFISKAQVTIVVNSIPVSTPVGAEIFISGTFNNWDPGNAAYKLNEIVNGHPAITLNVTGLIKFKFTRGAWVSVEGDQTGAEITDRQLTVIPGTTVNLNILSWKDLSGTSGGTALPSVSVMSQDFYIPQLNRNRTIWVCLPTDYSISPNKHYRVMYMQDGQNLFDDNLSFAGEWKIDESMRDLVQSGDPGAIIVGIENGPGRMDEYSPWNNTQYNAGGEGAQYVDFIKNTLKPYVDSNYRTLTDPKNTAITGSSLGGNISMYAAINYPETFGKAGLFSPAFWFMKPNFIPWISTQTTPSIRCYFVAGTAESSTMISDITNVKNELISIGVVDSNLRVVAKQDGAHSEWFWGREFEDAYNYLFPDWEDTPLGFQSISTFEFEVYPNPFMNSVSITLTENQQYTVELFDLTGRKVFMNTLNGGHHCIYPQLKNSGIYTLVIADEKGNHFRKRIVKIG